MSFNSSLRNATSSHASFALIKNISPMIITSHHARRRHQRTYCRWRGREYSKEPFINLTDVNQCFARDPSAFSGDSSRTKRASSPDARLQSISLPYGEILRLRDSPFAQDDGGHEGRIATNLPSRTTNTPLATAGQERVPVPTRPACILICRCWLASTKTLKADLPFEVSDKASIKGLKAVLNARQGTGDARGAHLWATTVETEHPRTMAEKASLRLHRPLETAPSPMGSNPIPQWIDISSIGR